MGVKSEKVNGLDRKSGWLHPLSKETKMERRV
jgi:hypothetical protein